MGNQEVFHVVIPQTQLRKIFEQVMINNLINEKTYKNYNNTVGTVTIYLRRATVITPNKQTENYSVDTHTATTRRHEERISKSSDDLIHFIYIELVYKQAIATASNLK